MKTSIKTAIIGAFTLIGAAFAGTTIANAAGDSESDYEMKHIHWHFDGFRGTYDRAAMQRGYQVYKEVCASCHQLKFMSFRHLGDKGGPFYDEHFKNPSDNPVVKGLAGDWEVTDIDLDTGEEITRKAIPSDNFPAIYSNKIAAAASNNGKAPPDLSVIVKARSGGADYIYNLLVAYDEEHPTENPVFGGQIAMAAPLYEDAVEYADGTPATVDQMAKDVTEFLAWAADPKMEQRKSLGLAVMIYLLILTILAWFTYKQVWRNVKH
ncbi:MAG: cytochrome c1 [Hellea sp.]|nr:cytochrome c1 [Hellea sp.]